MKIETYGEADIITKVLRKMTQPKMGWGFCGQRINKEHDTNEEEM